MPLGAIEEEHLLFVSQRSLNQLANELQIQSIHAERFRPNFIYTLDRLEISEEELYGKVIQIGSEVQVEFVRECERCSIINVDPESGQRGHLIRIKEEVDPNLEMAALHLRVYAENGPALYFENVKG